MKTLNSILIITVLVFLAVSYILIDTDSVTFSCFCKDEFLAIPAKPEDIIIVKSDNAQIALFSTNNNYDKYYNSYSLLMDKGSLSKYPADAFSSITQERFHIPKFDSSWIIVALSGTDLKFQHIKKHFYTSYALFINKYKMQIIGLTILLILTINYPNLAHSWKHFKTHIIKA